MGNSSDLAAKHSHALETLRFYQSLASFLEMPYSTTSGVPNPEAQGLEDVSER